MTEGGLFNLLSRLILVICLGWCHLSCGAAPDLIRQNKQALDEEIHFQAFDQVELTGPERCPSWLDVKPTDISCRRLTVIYRGVYLSGMLIEQMIRTDVLTIYHVGHESIGQAQPTGTPAQDSTLSDMPVELVYRDAAWFISRLLDRKSNVLVLFMPGMGMNPPATTAESVRRTHKLLSNHNAFSLLDYPGDSAASYFIAHVRAFLDRYSRQYRKVTMIGRSGGGWTTTIAAAAEPRIQCSISFFGSLPLRLRLPIPEDNRDDLGDFEQYGLYLFKRLDFTDLYALATAPSRQHTEVYNFKDDCCFSGEVKGSKVKKLVDTSYPKQRGFHVDILPQRSDKDHANLDEAALDVVNRRCPVQ